MLTEKNESVSSPASLPERLVASSGEVHDLANQDQPDPRSVLTLIALTFLTQFSQLANSASVIADQIEARTKAIELLKALTDKLPDWNSPAVPANDAQITKTNALLVAGVAIEDSSYDRCSYKAASSGELLYSDFPPATYEDFIEQGKVPTEGQLVYRFRENDYKVYRGGSLRDVFSPLPLQRKTTADLDFSEYAAGDIVLVEPTGKYYFVAEDGSATQLTNYPLQKFIYTLADTELPAVKNAIDKKSAAIRDLSKKDALDIQSNSATLTTLSTVMAAMLNTLTTVSNTIAAKIT